MRMNCWRNRSPALTQQGAQHGRLFYCSAFYYQLDAMYRTRWTALDNSGRAGGVLAILFLLATCKPV